MSARRSAINLQSVSLLTRRSARNLQSVSLLTRRSARNLQSVSPGLLYHCHIVELVYQPCNRCFINIMC